MNWRMIITAVYLMLIFLIPQRISSSTEKLISTHIHQMLVQKYFLSRNPKLFKNKQVQRDVQKLISYSYQYCELDNQDTLLCISQSYLEGEQFNKINAKTIGKKGEVSYFQFMTNTAKGLGYTVRKLKNIRYAVEARCKFFKWLLNKYNDNYKALRYYNGGGRWRKKKVTHTYAEKVFKIKEDILKFVKENKQNIFDKLQ